MPQVVFSGPNHNCHARVFNANLFTKFSILREQLGIAQAEVERRATSTDEALKTIDRVVRSFEMQAEANKVLALRGALNQPPAEPNTVHVTRESEPAAKDAPSYQQPEPDWRGLQFSDMASMEELMKARTVRFKKANPLPASGFAQLPRVVIRAGKRISPMAKITFATLLAWPRSAINRARKAKYLARRSG